MSAFVTVPQADTLGDAGHRLEVAHLSKTFGSARVLRNIDLQIAPGELHGLVGQNGCGKSTLVKILSGIYTPDSGGSIAVDGRPLALPVQPMDARAAGVAVVHQNLGLVDDGPSGKTSGSAATRRPAGSPGGSTPARKGKRSRKSSAAWARLISTSMTR